MIALDNGIADRNYNAADFFFLLGAIAAVAAAVFTWVSYAATTTTDTLRHASPLGWIAVACLGLGLLLL